MWILNGSNTADKVARWRPFLWEFGFGVMKRTDVKDQDAEELLQIRTTRFYNTALCDHLPFTMVKNVNGDRTDVSMTLAALKRKLAILVFVKHLSL